MDHTDIIGQAFVNEEIPPPGSFPFFLKPITWLMLLTFIGWFCFIELIRERFYKLTSNWKFLLSLLLFLIVSLSFYEVLYNFMFWGSMLSKQKHDSLNPDTIINSFPDEDYKVNLVFASKIAVLVFICSLYALFMLNQKNTTSNIL